jgi:hypothetical protein
LVYKQLLTMAHVYTFERYQSVRTQIDTHCIFAMTELTLASNL